MIKVSEIAELSNLMCVRNTDVCVLYYTFVCVCLCTKFAVTYTTDSANDVLYIFITLSFKEQNVLLTFSN